jgi:hypothetical protein
MLDGRNIRMETYLFVGIVEILEVDVEVSSETLSLRLQFIPAPHANVPGAMVNIIFRY